MISWCERTQIHRCIFRAVDQDDSVIVRIFHESATLICGRLRVAPATGRPWSSTATHGLSVLDLGQTAEGSGLAKGCIGGCSFLVVGIRLPRRAAEPIRVTVAR
jgi:hypothetical protein